MLKLNDGRSELWQWDTGRKLSVDAECSQVHFSNKVFGRSIDVNVVGGVATIPDILLQTDKDLIVWGFVGTPENGYTKISKFFKVNRRNKPSNYVFTPPEQTTLGEIMERLDRIEESQDPDAIKNAVDEYLASNPIQTEEKDPTVPDWAKEPIKPAYTASEVGALPADTNIPETPEDIGAQPKNLIVTIDESTMTASHSASEIKEHMISGGDAVCTSGDAVLPLIGVGETSVIFSTTQSNGEFVFTLIATVNDDKSAEVQVYETTAPVQSVNGKTGAVELTAEDVNAQPKNLVVTVDQSTGKASHSASEIKTAVDSGVDVVLYYNDVSMPLRGCNGESAAFVLMSGGTSAIATVLVTVNADKTAVFEVNTYTPPVQSVNGKTGAVSLTASDVGALPSDTVIPEAVTDDHINSLIDAKLGVIENGTY